MTGVDELDPVIHAAARLKITATLATVPDGGSMSFPRLQELLDLTAGNLATHLRKLEDAGYVEVEKAHRGRVPVTYLALTTTGRRAFEDYTATLRGILGERLAMGDMLAPTGALRGGAR